MLRESEAEREGGRRIQRVWFQTGSGRDAGSCFFCQQLKTRYECVSSDTSMVYVCVCEREGGGYSLLFCHILLLN